MEYIHLIGTVSFILFLALLSPGPDFLLTIKNSMQYSRRTGIFTAIGLGGGIAVHISYCLAGLAIIISQQIILFNILKFLGAGYLMYIGFQSFFSKSNQIDISEISEKEKVKNDISPFQALKIGFLGNVLNPKATLFFMSLFTLVISPETPNFILGILSIIMISMTMLWFSLVAIFFTQPKVQKTFNKFQKFFNKFFGSLLIALGVKIALSEK